MMRSQQSSVQAESDSMNAIDRAPAFATSSRKARHAVCNSTPSAISARSSTRRIFSCLSNTRSSFQLPIWMPRKTPTTTITKSSPTANQFCERTWCVMRRRSIGGLESRRTNDQSSVAGITCQIRFLLGDNEKKASDPDFTFRASPWPAAEYMLQANKFYGEPVKKIPKHLIVILLALLPASVTCFAQSRRSRMAALVQCG